MRYISYSLPYVFHFIKKPGNNQIAVQALDYII
jgi:hypothetical protein